ncbi:hypothetical protein EKH55_1150 [Sinorhizobium alkalisoli]|nr:hypothetical protein EKH55_1150 [Sinorhizobium alkalisoli]
MDTPPNSSGGMYEVQIGFREKKGKRTAAASTGPMHKRKTSLRADRGALGAHNGRRYSFR